MDRSSAAGKHTSSKTPTTSEGLATTPPFTTFSQTFDDNKHSFEKRQTSVRERTQQS